MARKDHRRAGRRGKFYQGLISKLYSFAQAEFELNQVQDDGATMRQHLESHERQTGVTPEMLVANHIPLEIEYLWDWFAELNDRRRRGGMAASLLIWADVDAWARLLRRDPQPWEIEVLMRLDNIWFNFQVSKK